MIQAREFTSAAECIASAAAIREKFYGRKPPVMVKKPEPKPAVKIVTKEPVKHFKKPLWMKVPILFDEHVVGYRVRKIIHAMEECGQIERVPVGKRPIEAIVIDVLKDFPEFTVEDLKSPRRYDKLVMARQMAIYEVRKQRVDMSLPAIGRWFGGRDHSTIHHSIMKISKLRGELPR